MKRSLAPFAQLSVIATFCFFILLLFSNVSLAQKKSSNQEREFIQIRIYHAVDSVQLELINRYLQTSLLPALEAGGFKKTGVFTAIGNDTARDKKIYVFTALPALTQLQKLIATSNKSIGDSIASPAYIKAAYNQPPYLRFETILLQAFTGAPLVTPSRLTGNLTERVYELRSYESATEALHQNKVQMFNAGEVELFERLGFNAVFYGQVVAGSHMPNLMYMTSFENKALRDEHWKAFGGDPAWKTMSAKPEYQHNVSKIDIVFLRPMGYSKL